LSVASAVAIVSVPGSAVFAADSLTTGGARSAAGPTTALDVAVNVPPWPSLTLNVTPYVPCDE
jgi:hypothetical protein